MEIDDRSLNKKLKIQEILKALKRRNCLDDRYYKKTETTTRKNNERSMKVTFRLKENIRGILRQVHKLTNHDKLRRLFVEKDRPREEVEN